MQGSPFSSPLPIVSTFAVCCFLARSIREMVRKYREELSWLAVRNGNRVFSSEEDFNGGTKPVNDTRPFPAHKYCWNAIQNAARSSMQEMDDFANFQDLDRRATEVLRRSQQVLEGEHTCKSSVALTRKSGFHTSGIQTSNLPGTRLCSPHSLETRERRNRKSHRCTGDVVTRNFEEIEKILGECNLIMEQNSSSNEDTKHLEQVSAREMAASRAANAFLKKGAGHCSALATERMLESATALAEVGADLTCRNLVNISDGLTGSADPACHLPTFNTRKQYGWQTTELSSLQSSVLCHESMICDISVPETSRATSAKLPVMNEVKTACSDVRWLSKSEHLHSEKFSVSSKQANNGDWESLERINFGNVYLGGTNANGRLLTGSRSDRTTTERQRPNVVDCQHPYSMRKTSIKNYPKYNNSCSTQIPLSHAGSFWQGAGGYDPDMSGIESRSCVERWVRMSSYEPGCLETRRVQVLMEDLQMDLGNSGRKRASLRSSSSEHQFKASCEGRWAYPPQPYLSQNSSMSPVASEFVSCKSSNGVAVVEEREELALRHNQRKDSRLGAAVNSNFKERGQEDFDCSALTAGIPNNNLVFDHSNSREAGNHSPGTVSAKILETRQSDQTSYMFPAPVRTHAANEAAQIAETCMPSEKASIQVEISSDLSLETFFPLVLTVKEDHCATSCQVSQRLHHSSTSSIVSPELDLLISEVIREWVGGGCNTSPTVCSWFGRQETYAASPTTSSITEVCSADFPVAEVETSLEERINIVRGVKVSEVNTHDPYRELQGSKSQPQCTELVKCVGKNSVAALASVVQPLLAALQGSEVGENIITEFEADETIHLLLEKLQFYDAKIRALKSRGKGNLRNQSSTTEN
ncbi:uncharacterized protein [Physcomitrium patens]|uniref:uncharacterized protein isoform X3 n=1 Tax=Physcomitrium patens TaxID=3218 RepID=UPI000D179E8A|nr:uncharacterized protein LOC112273653 isoform X2 [Physcomitrium patens]|eukprot:XP_024358454.1 uncharacterized protein LOC112273653 isoform X2 [Physcomitrella patens]